MEHRNGEVKSKRPAWQDSVLIASLVLIAVALVAGLTPFAQLWGINHLSYVPMLTVVVLVVLSAALQCPPAQRLALALGKPAASWIDRRRSPRLKRGWYLIPLCSFPLLWGFRSRTYLQGDGMLLTQALQLGQSFRWTEPLSHYLYTSAFALGNRIWGQNPVLVYQAINCVAGVLFVGLALLIGRDLARQSAARVFIFCCLVAPGATALYFGYVENYSLFYLACLLFLWLGVRTALGRGSLVHTALALSIAVMMHLAAIGFLPSLAVLAIRGPRGERPGLRSLIAAAAAFVVPPLLLASWFFLTGIRPGDLDRPAVSLLLPLVGGGSGAYTVFSARHLLDVVNEYLLVAWTAVLLCPGLLVRRPIAWRRPAVSFLMTATVLMALFCLFVNPGLGMARDWDLFAVVGLPWLLLSLYLFVDEDRSRRELTRATFAIVSVALVVTFPWVLTNADEGRSVARFRDLLDYYVDLPLTAYGHEILSIHFRDHKMIEDEIRELERAAELRPDNFRYAANLGIAYRLAGRADLAIAQFERAVELEPNRFENYANLARAYHLAGREELAMDALEAAVRLSPGFVEGRFSLAGLYLRRGMAEEAVAEYENVIRIAPRSPYAIEAQMRLQQLYKMREEGGEGPAGSVDTGVGP
ncbi:hypothetical protein AMJ71_08110 [candidate division TA06 bacterium SM1_40]|uniref:Uncharacterized protein n=2 Tax=Bacteria division TA06 TaxID=1156500 RepID=A0A0S8JIA2_UNCT6|nr:MAG: hypothetical protein AMJ71_08110 [candidate division TA06 bacterium SM1_40]